MDIVAYCLEKLGDFRHWNGSYCTSNWTMVLLTYSIKSKEQLGIHKAFQFLADILLMQGDKDTAYSLFTVALEGFTHLDVHRSRAECMLYLGDILKEQGELLQAAKLWKTARPLFERSSQAKQVKHIDERLYSMVFLEAKSDEVGKEPTV
jgi:tetratricopeptide (TPR) repeat protein